MLTDTRLRQIRGSSKPVKISDGLYALVSLAGGISFRFGAIDQKKLDEQCGVVQIEKRQGQNRPYGKVDEVIAASTYPMGHPYSWETIGSMDDLNAASLEDVKAWFRTYYGEKTAESMTEMLKELRDIGTTRPPKAEEIQFAKDSTLLSMPSDIETADGVAGFYGTVLAYGLPDTYWNDYVGEVTALTPVQLQAIATKRVQPSTLTWVVIGDLAKIEPAIRKLNLGEVKVIDADGKELR